MSETTTPPPETPAEFLEGVAATAPSQAAEVVTETTETTPEPEPAPKPDRVERRIANLTRKMAEETRAREAAERERDAALALANAGKEESAPPARNPTQDIEARAAQLLAERQYNARLGEIDAAGRKEMGAEPWQQAVDTMTGLGASHNTAFLQALAETDNAAKIFAQLADDTDELVELLAKSPAAMAARLGKMDAKLSQPVARPLSAAPTPPPRVKTGGVAPEPDIYNYPANMSMKEWNKVADQFLPASLGGKKRSA